MTKRMILVAVLLLSILALTPRTAAAAGVVGTGTPGSCTEAALNTALSGGGTVTFNCGTAPHTIVLTTPKNITTNTVINGGRLGLITLDGNGLARQFNVSSAVFFTVRNITLYRGNQAIYHAGSGYVEIDRVNVRQMGSSAAVEMAAGVSGQTRVTHSYFSDNASWVLHIKGTTLTVLNCSFFNNGDDVIVSEADSATIVASRFESNLGTGIRFEGTSANTQKLQESVFKGNGLSAVYSTTQSLEITRTEFLAHTIGVPTVNLAGGSTALFKEVRFYGNINTAGTGGAIRSNVPTTTIVGSEFTNNQSAPGSPTAKGGAVYVTSSTIVMRENTFSQNKSYSGGAIYVDTGSSVLLSDNTFTLNEVASKGGAIYVNSSVVGVTINRSYFSSNRVLSGGVGGGAIYLATASEVVIANSTFDGNFMGGASGYGGAIAATSTVPTTHRVYHSTFNSNTAPANSGAALAAIAGGGTITYRIEGIILNNSTGGNCNSTGLVPVITSLGAAQTNIQTGLQDCVGPTFRTADPLLLTAADNGGYTYTMKLNTGSSALDNADPTYCNSPQASNEDQRGTSRIFTGSTTCDIGAYESPVTYACTLGDFDAAINNSGGAYFPCGVPTTIVIPAGQQKTISSRSFIQSDGMLTIEGNVELGLLVAPAGTTLQIRDVTIKNVENVTSNFNSMGIQSTGGRVLISGVTFNGNSIAVQTAGTPPDHIWIKNSIFDVSMGQGVYYNPSSFPSRSLTIINTQFQAAGFDANSMVSVLSGNAKISQTTFTATSSAVVMLEVGAAGVDTQANVSAFLNHFTGDGIGFHHHSPTFGAMRVAMLEQNSFIMTGKAMLLEENPVNNSVLQITNTTAYSTGSQPTIQLSGPYSYPFAVNSIHNTFANANQTVLLADTADDTFSFHSQNTIFSQTDVGGPPVCTGRVAELGNSLQFPADSSCGTIVNGDPKLLPPALNSAGFTTYTMALRPGSAAVDAGLSTTCDRIPVQQLDQRYFPRPLDGNGDGMITCDIGAYEAPPAPTIAKAFSPALILSGGNTQITFTLNNLNTSSNYTNVSFTDLLPSGMTVSANPNVMNSCPTQGTVDAEPGSSTITVVGAGVNFNSFCTIKVNVTSSRIGTYNNIASAISSLQTGAGTTSNTAVLSVARSPALNVSFAPASVGINRDSVLTFRLTNPNTIALTGVNFINNLPANVVVSPIPNVITTCTPSPSIVALPSSSEVTVTAGQMPANSDCAISVNVRSSVAGTYNNTTETVASLQTGLGGISNTGTLIVLSSPTVALAFTPSTVDLNGVSTVTYQLANPNANTRLTGVGLTHALPIQIDVAAIPSLINTCSAQGTVNATPGSSTVTLSALELEPNETCFVKVNVVGTASGTYNTTTSPISSTQTGLAGVSNLASLNVNSNAQVVSGSFNPNVVTVGTPSTLTFQITAGVLDVTGVGFTDTLPPGLKVAPSPQITNSCDTQGSVNALANATQITIAGVGKALPGTCSISVKVVGTRTGNFNNLTGAITSNTGTGSPVSTGILSVIGSPTVNVGLAPRTIGIGKQTRITYTITNPNSERPLTNVGFNVTLPMNVAVSSEPDLENSCSLAGSNTVTPSTQTYSFSGIGLNPAEVCDISFNFVVSNAGSYTVSMSTVTSTEVGLGAPGNPVSIAVLTPPTFVQTFMPSIVKVGDASTLTYTITNPNATTLTEGTFENILPDGLLIASPNGLNLTNCGTGSAIGVSGTNLISTQDLQIVTAGPCVITVNVVGSEPGIYRNEPEGLQTDQTGIGAPPTPINLRVARYDCTIGGLDTAITNGGDATFACTSNTTLGITAVRNFATSTTIDGAGFLTLKNEIDAGQPPKDSKGATATPIRPNARDGRTFGAFGIESGATVRFTGLTFENGNHPTIPPLISSGTLYLTNVTFRNNTISGALLINSGSTATIINSTFENNMVNTSDGAAIYADSASTLTVVNSTFNGNSAPGWSGGAIYVVGGATVNLINSTIANNSADVAGGVYVEGGATFTLTNTVFSNNSGDNCAGPGTITNNGGNIQYPGITCGAAITTADPLLGSLTNNGGQTLTMALGVGSPAINAGVLSVCATNPVRAVDQRGRIRALDLTCDSGAFEYNAPLPTFSISAPTTIGAGVDFNVTVTALDSTDNTVTGYTGIVGLTSNDGAAVLPIARAYTPDDYGSYTFSVRLNTLGARTVTATDQTDLFNAVANITVLANPTVGLAFAPSAISTNGITTLTYTLSNPNAATALSGIQFTNTMPSQLAVAADPFLGGSCTTSFFSATPGSQTITVQGVTLPASGSCTLTVNVTSATNGEWLNQVNTITSLQTGTGSGSSPVALAVGPAAPTVSASFLNSTINRLNATALTYTVTNPNATALTNVSFSHTLPTQITVFTPFTMTNTCSTAGSVTGSGTLITITGVGLTGAESCTITVYVMSNTVGTWNTQTGIITATENANGAASGTISLTVNQARVDTIGVYRSANRTFYLRNSNTTGAPDITVAYQSVNPASDRPITGDWNNDTVDTIGVYDTSEGVFYLRDSNTAGVPNYAFVLGNPNDMPLAGHWASDMSGDGVGVYRSSNGVLYLKKTLVTGVADYFAILGNPGDIGIAGDWDGDGLDTAGVYRPSNSWMYLINNPTPSGIVFSDQSFIFGDGATDTPFVGDIVGQGRSAYAVRRGNSMIGEAKIFVENNIGSYPQWVFSYGDIGDTPLLGHWTIGATPSLLNGIVIQGPPVLNDEGGRAD